MRKGTMYIFERGLRKCASFVGMLFKVILNVIVFSMKRGRESIARFAIV